MQPLSERKCQPCDGGVQPLTRQQAEELLTQTPGWEISDDDKWLSRKFKFTNFADALAFVNKIGEIAEGEDHHPDIALGWGKVKVKLTTHSIGGLSENDYIVAAKVNNL